MKDIIKNTLTKLSQNNISLDTETGRDYISKQILKSFQNKHIVFYTNLEKHNEEKMKRGL